MQRLIRREFRPVTVSISDDRSVTSLEEGESADLLDLHTGTGQQLGRPTGLCERRVEDGDPSWCQHAVVQREASSNRGVEDQTVIAHAPRRNRLVVVGRIARVARDGEARACRSQRERLRDLSRHAFERSVERLLQRNLEREDTRFVLEVPRLDVELQSPRPRTLRVRARMRLNAVLAAPIRFSVGVRKPSTEQLDKSPVHLPVSIHGVRRVETDLFRHPNAHLVEHVDEGQPARLEVVESQDEVARRDCDECIAVVDGERFEDLLEIHQGAPLPVPQPQVSELTTRVFAFDFGLSMRG